MSLHVKTFNSLHGVGPILNKGKETLISYTGTTSAGTKNITPSGDTNATYEFFYGTVTITVTGNFESVSIYCYYHGYMGGEKLLEYIKDIMAMCAL